MQIYVSKAGGIGHRPVNDLRIYATEPMQTRACIQNNFVLKEPAEKMKSDGDLIVAAMLESLPGGTIDHVLIGLLEHRRSQLVVCHRPINLENESHADPSTAQ